jgi:hypothetical protein
MKVPVPVEPTVRAWLERYLEPGVALRGRSFLEESPRLAGDSEYERLLGEVHDAIKSRSPITERDDLEAVLLTEVLSELIESPAAGWDVNTTTSRISERLLMAEKDYDFSTPLSLRGK